jgi:hypothetical protein
MTAIPMKLLSRRLFAGILLSAAMHVLQAGDLTFTDKMVPVPASKWRHWSENAPSHHGGDYEGENGAGGVDLILKSYFDDQSQTIRYSGCVLITSDVATKPEIRVEGVIKGDGFKIYPVEIQNTDGKWIQGMVYDSVFCAATRR